MKEIVSESAAAIAQSRRGKHQESDKGYVGGESFDNNDLQFIRGGGSLVKGNGERVYVGM